MTRPTTNAVAGEAQTSAVGGLVMQAAGLSPVAPLRSSKGEALPYWTDLRPSARDANRRPAGEKQRSAQAQRACYCGHLVPLKHCISSA